MNDATRNIVWSGSAGTVIQAGTVRGGLHLHLPAERRPGVPRQLPIPPRWMVARDQELDRLTAAFDRGPNSHELVIVTVEGTGGMGKTALALFWAHHNLARFPDGQLFVDLRGFDSTGAPMSPSTALRGFLIALGVDPTAIPADESTATTLYRSVLAGKRMILVLDNAFDSAQVMPLLPGDSSCGVIVTSRHRLPGLLRFGASRLRLESLSYAGAREFLVRHIGDIVDAEHAAADTLLNCCAGLPLALAIVVARVSNHPDFPLSLLAHELAEESAGLDAFDAGDDVTNLRAVLSWSSAGLDDHQARLFRLLGMASLPEIGLDAAASLLALSAQRTIRLLRALEARSLVHQHRPRRFQLHDLLRRHAAELSAELDSAPTRSAALMRLVDFYLHTARVADRLLYPHRAPVPATDLADGCTPLRLADELAALDWFAEEHHQILAVQQLAVCHGWPDRVWQLSRVLDTYHYRRSHIQTNIDTSRLGADAADAIGDTAVRSLAHRQLGRAYTRSGRLADADAALRLALSLTREAGDLVGQAHTLHDLARARHLEERHEEALSYSASATTLYRITGNSVGEAHALGSQGRQHATLGNHQRARDCCELALTLHQANGNDSGQVATLETLGLVATQTGRHVEAAKHYRRALVLCRSQRNSFVEAQIVEHLAGVHITQGQVVVALDALRQAQDLYANQHRTADADRVRLTIAGIENR